MGCKYYDLCEKQKQTYCEISGRKERCDSYNFFETTKEPTTKGILNSGLEQELGATN